MQEILLEHTPRFIGLEIETGHTFAEPVQFPTYTVIFIPNGSGLYKADSSLFPFEGPVLLFSKPQQYISFLQAADLPVTALKFQSDFYCIEYHREEISCNGLIFNNIYVEPCLPLSDKQAAVFQRLFTEMKNELSQPGFSEAVLSACLQLFLAKSAAIKLNLINSREKLIQKDDNMERFRTLLNNNYLTIHKPHEYAKMLSMSLNNFSKHSKSYFKKAPSVLIKEKLIHEAKMRLHLTSQSIKEIAHALNFKDEFYFSRYFKKFVKISPRQFRIQNSTYMVNKPVKSAETAH